MAEQRFSVDYQVVYNVGLLDDLHNYFPALLYNHSRFQNVPSILHYVRNQLNTRFNLYSYGASLVEQRDPPQPQQRIPTRAQPSQMPLDSTNDLLSTLLFGLLSQNDVNVIDLQRVSPFVRTSQRGGRETNPQNYFDPVIVRATDEVIERNTQVLNGSDIPAGTICVICQDIVRSNETSRKIIACAHTFHKTCIDQWFQTNVHCPTCRHDIREAVIAPPHTAQQGPRITPRANPSSPRGPVL